MAAAEILAWSQRLPGPAKAVDEAGLADNTLVVFTSDNGGHPEYAANAPWRGNKWNLYEGGIRVPWILRQPGRLPSGMASSQVMLGYDLLPTVLEAIGGTASNQEIDGTSIWQFLQPESSLLSRDVYWHFPYYHPETGFGMALQEIGLNDFQVSRTRPCTAMRSADLKLHYFYEDNRLELYDLSQDPSEAHNLSSEKPEVADRMRRQMFDYLTTVNARLPQRHISE